MFNKDTIQNFHINSAFYYQGKLSKAMPVKELKNFIDPFYEKRYNQIFWEIILSKYFKYVFT